jgi:hypothetical protein
MAEYLSSILSLHDLEQGGRRLPKHAMQYQYGMKADDPAKQGRNHPRFYYRQGGSAGKKVGAPTFAPTFFE